MYTHIYVDTRKLSEIINAQFLVIVKDIQTQYRCL